MIRVILQGRTGNNLFQYAAGRALSERHQVPLVLDGSWVNPSQESTFRHLLRLPIKACYENSLSPIKRLSRRLFDTGPLNFYKGEMIVDPDNGVVPDLSQAGAQTVLIGFFQSPLHFKGLEKALKEELDLNTLELPADSRRFEEALRSKPTVSIHVRRGDYLAISNTQCLSENYHEEAIRRFRERHEEIRFCVFSDDIGWCRKQFVGNEFLFCDFPIGHQDPLHDMRLMSTCHHHIIVNSSYSWWGAWLNTHTGQKVIAPKTWMRGTPSEFIIPESWVTL
ncbi:alpha-1,2-fucosyltransferase [Luteolibacter sp. SL250]|uniref:alpha-1,2-fucosyltransferase n=1 Tax=Luteolibacter sp. SL250 TaxID=2995170 RepID=UPI00226F5FC2|nr:alpha-1,2-fucosyltransferase [Luteolibacter sp. SL250]WAC20446.1 alpha-1,2-fucosyltransferase [Luteolibacter sp. SL250]